MTTNETQSLGHMPEDVFARKLRERRLQRGLSQAQVAREVARLTTSIDLDATAITRIEKGDRRVRFNEVVAICMALGLDIYEVIQEHPGDLQDQLDRVWTALNNATAARTFWEREEAQLQARFEAIKEQYDAMLANEAERAAFWEQQRAKYIEDTGWGPFEEEGAE